MMETFTQHLHLPVTCVDHSEVMLSKLKGLTDPEAKRKCIGAEFIEVFKTYAIKLEKELGTKPKFLVQVRRATVWCLSALSLVFARLPFLCCV